eukprot:Blabericola_migrator_1__2263@NODE_1626_length_4142_cov_67_299877_g1059_i0_p3_GENE_NODE_1626_length_4142_cov_67_299877_g1059_i0NODE_1626_length_4142_cov_67_299877_g1059_i0_p3_ORF_typecomplete_len224_score33_00DUF3169/PF11368_8/0_0015DUF3169/PF11368_8/28MARVEL/PF01284_23/0_37_NODE_1626_length_4142_cov_67_299877_g1059_i029803651
MSTKTMSRRAARGGTATTVASSLKSDSQQVTRLSTHDQDFEVMEEPIAQKKITVPYMLTHPNVVPRLLLQSIAGTYWIQVRTQLHFFPLSFINKESEAEYREHLNQSYRLRLPIGMSLIALSSLLSWFLMGAAKYRGWIDPSGSEHIWTFFHLSGAVSSVATIFCIFVPFFKLTKKRVEMWFYLCTSVNNLVWMVWACWSIIEASPEDLVIPWVMAGGSVEEL